MVAVFAASTAPVRAAPALFAFTPCRTPHGEASVTVIELGGRQDGRCCNRMGKRGSVSVKRMAIEYRSCSFGAAFRLQRATGARRAPLQ
eukprot:CAMPEP_0172762610 /NCGR_PEP_ID=MMETSP1074-20121228/173812_1 /TAXON_ID=2916 /ORGANISM="Ceratium fusus, Strain PA161109" /LENGTH=88 /DNA_ID=CAMNT_0013597035 /DNA_START=80 /DNA_END=346 /DNA_ORIENTATION=+